MSEPRRLLDEGGDDVARALLRSARDDAPSRGARRRMLVALGLAGGLGATASATTSASTALVKSIGLGVLGGAVVVGSVSAARVSASRSAAVAATVVTARAPEAPPRAAVAGPAETSVPAEPAATAEPSSAPAPAPAPVPVEPPRAAQPSARPALPSLAEEVAALDAARAALAAGDTTRALAALDNRDRRFPGGALGPEALVVRIQALARRGDRAAAARLGEAYLAAHPNGVHAAFVRSLLGAPAPAAP